RAEFALLNALGIRRGQIAVLVAAEYGLLVGVGLVVGILPALVAIQPAAYALGGQMPWGVMGGIVALLFVSAAASIAIAAGVAARGK
ncbi:MAG: hypothetical protein FWH21_05355, partial [Kiritimatiellaeota bacterium]|nr:hypothetical protein [Kiritimatiellota bacterium]